MAALAFCLVAGVAVAQEPPKGNEPPPGPGSGLPETTGGPDGFGYTYEDSLEPGCAYDFIDISATGALVVSGDDVSSGPLAVADFSYYGTTYSTLVMASNGYISTDPTDTGPDLSNDCPLPATPSTGGGARIYPLHDDLVTNTGYFEYFPVCPRANSRCTEGGDDCSIFMWDDATHFGGTETFDVEAILYHQTGDIVFQFGPGNPEAGSGSTTGIQNDGATIGLTYACDTAASIAENSAVCFRNPADPPFGTCRRAAPPDIPTMNTTGILLMLLALAGAGVFVMRRYF